jgi:hypothetical protein
MSKTICVEEAVVAVTVTELADPEEQVTAGDVHSSIAAPVADKVTSPSTHPGWTP